MVCSESKDKVPRTLQELQKMSLMPVSFSCVHTEVKLSRQRRGQEIPPLKIIIIIYWINEWICLPPSRGIWSEHSLVWVSRIHMVPRLRIWCKNFMDLKTVGLWKVNASSLRLLHKTAWPPNSGHSWGILAEWVGPSLVSAALSQVLLLLSFRPQNS